MAYEAKTVPTGASVKDFIASVEHEGRREDALVLLKLFEKATGWKAQMWGPSIIGFGKTEFSYDSGHSGIMLVCGFSPRKANMVLYINKSFAGADALIKKLGKAKTGAGCTYIGRLSSIDLDVLEELIRKGVADAKKTRPVSAK
jgi:hypothetical protein